MYRGFTNANTYIEFKIDLSNGGGQVKADPARDSEVLGSLPATFKNLVTKSGILNLFRVCALRKRMD